MARTYAFVNTRLVVGGFLMESFEKGSSIKVGRNEDAFSEQVGADGKMVRSRHADRSGYIEFVLQQGSPSNAVLSAMATLDETPAGVPVPVIFIDGNTTAAAPESAISKAAWVKKKPDAEYAAEVSGRKWKLILEDVDFILGAYAN